MPNLDFILCYCYTLYLQCKKIKRINFFYFFKFICTLFILLSSTFLLAQNTNGIVKFNIENEETIDYNKVLTYVFKIDNQRNDSLLAKVKLPTNSSINFLVTSDVKVKLAPYKKAFIPIKFTLSKNTTNKEIDLDFKLIEDLTNKEYITQTKITIPLRKSIKMFPITSNLNYSKIGDSISYEVRLVNDGNVPDKISLTSTYTDYLGVLISESKFVELLPSEEKVVRFSKYVNYELLKLERFMPRLLAYNGDNEYSGTLSYTIYNVNSSKTFLGSNSTFSTSELNNITLNFRGSNLNDKYLNLQSHHEFNVGYNEYAYNISAYSSLANQSLQLSNFWLDYQRKGKGIRVGNISYGNLELSVLGRGGLVYQNIAAQNNKIVLGLVEQNTDLFSDVIMNDIKQSTSVFAHTKFKISEKDLESSVVYQRTNQLKNFIFSNEYKWISKNEWNYYFKTAYGNTSTYTNDSKNGIALNFNISGKLGTKYTFYSSNYYSTPYYIGNRRGAIIFQQRLQRNFNKFTIYGSATVSIFKPKSLLADQRNLNNNINTYTAEIGTNFKLFKNLSVNISPRSVEESSMVLNSLYVMEPISVKTNYVASSFFMSSRSREHQYYINFSGGFNSVNHSKASKTAFVLNASWNYRKLRINSTLQKGSLMLLDRLSGYDDDKMRYNFYLDYKKDFFRSKLKSDLIASYNYYEKYGDNFNLTINNSYIFRNMLNLNLSINANYSRTNLGSSKQLYYQFGAQYNLPSKSTKVGERYGNLNVFVFYDYNTNGIFDEGDKIASDRVLHIKDVSFITDNTGKINYKRIPYGEYNISIPGQKWYAKEVTINLEAKNTTIAIPMQLTGIVKGRLKIESRSKLEVDVVDNLFAIGLIFEDQNKNKTIIKTNSKGEFTAYLPIGEYTFSINEENLPKNVYPEVYSHKVTVEAEKTVDYPTIILLIKEKKVNIKRFGS